MSREFRIRKDYWDIGEDMFDKGRFTINRGVTVLIGCNGAGKTSHLMQIKETLRERKIPFFEYNDVVDGRDMGKSRVANAFMFNPALLATMVCSSEGENIVINLGQKAEEIGKMIRGCLEKDEKEAWVLLDAVDSGLSIDNVMNIKNYLFKPIMATTEGKLDAYIVVAANSFEMAKGEDCLNVITQEHVKVTDYEEYRKIILETFRRKDERGKQTR